MADGPRSICAAGPTGEEPDLPDLLSSLKAMNTHGLREAGDAIKWHEHRMRKWLQQSFSWNSSWNSKTCKKIYMKFSGWFSWYGSPADFQRVRQLCSLGWGLFTSLSLNTLITPLVTVVLLHHGSCHLELVSQGVPKSRRQQKRLFATQWHQDVVKLPKYPLHPLRDTMKYLQVSPQGRQVCKALRMLRMQTLRAKRNKWLETVDIRYQQVPSSHQTSGLRTPPRYIRFPAPSSIVDRKLLFPSNVQSENDQLAVVLLGQTPISHRIHVW